LWYCIHDFNTAMRNRVINSNMYYQNIKSEDKTFLLSVTLTQNTWCQWGRNLLSNFHSFRNLIRLVNPYCGVIVRRRFHCNFLLKKKINKRSNSKRLPCLNLLRFLFKILYVYIKSSMEEITNLNAIFRNTLKHTY
jgi:hypothetical protein